MEVTELMSYEWIDDQTRVAFVDFATYNPGYNIVAQVHITVEFAATGYVHRMVEVLTTDHVCNHINEPLNEPTLIPGPIISTSD